MTNMTSFVIAPRHGESRSRVFPRDVLCPDGCGGVTFFLRGEQVGLFIRMDLICDRIIQLIREGRERDSVRVVLDLKTPHRPGRFAAVEPAKAECRHCMEFKPAYPGDEGRGFFLTVSGVRFRPTREVIKALVVAWLDELAEESGDDDRMSCALELSAWKGDRRIYNNRVKFDYCRRRARNKKAVNRLVEALMHVKGLCENMVDF